MPGSRLSGTEERLLRRWRSAKGYAQALRAIEIKGDATLRGLGDTRIEFGFPVTVLSGRNGAGKSTALALALLAFSDPRRPKRAVRRTTGKRRAPIPELADFTFGDFFFKGPHDVDPAGITIRWEYDGGQEMEIRKQSNKWMRYERRPKRPVVYLGMARCVPAIEQRALRTRFAGTPSLVPTAALDEEYRERLSNVLGRVYTHADVYGDARYGLRSLGTGTRYSGFNMGAGEDAIVQILHALQEAAPNSMVGIEEVEIGIHPAALQRLARQIVEIADVKSLQVVVTSHSEHFIDQVPREARILLQRLEAKTLVVPFPTTRMALSDMSDAVQYELSVYVEDRSAAELVRQALGPDLRKRIDLKSLGSNSELGTAAKTFRRCLPKQRFLFLLDGDATWPKVREWFADRDLGGDLPSDQPEAFAEGDPIALYGGAAGVPIWVAALPGTTAPERWAVDALRGHPHGPRNVADAFDLPQGAAEGATALERLAAMRDPHDIPFEAERLAQLAEGEGWPTIVRALWRTLPEAKARLAERIASLLA